MAYRVIECAVHFVLCTERIFSINTLLSSIDIDRMYLRVFLMFTICINYLRCFLLSYYYCLDFFTQLSFITPIYPRDTRYRTVDYVGRDERDISSSEKMNCFLPSPRFHETALKNSSRMIRKSPSPLSSLMHVKFDILAPV